MCAFQYYFSKDGQNFPANIKPSQVASMPIKIRDVFDQTTTYQIKSNVKDENIPLFIKYFLTKSEEPAIKDDNLYDFYTLSKEFEMDEITTEIDEKWGEILRIVILKTATTATNSDISESEKFISEHLDEYLLKYPNQMYAIPITSLCNIFFNKARKLDDENLGYRFITKQLKSDDDTNGQNIDHSLFVLLKSLDSNKLNGEALKDCISKQDEHFGFIPQINFGFIEILTKKVTEIESTMVQMQKDHQKNMKEIVSTMVQMQEYHQKKMKETESTIQKLVKQSTDMQTNIWFIAIKTANFEIVDHLLREGIDVNLRDDVVFIFL